MGNAASNVKATTDTALGDASLQRSQRRQRCNLDGICAHYSRPDPRPPIRGLTNCLNQENVTRMVTNTTN